MLKRLFAVAAVFIFLIAALPAFAGQLFDAQAAINDALDNSDYYLDVSKNGHPINYVSIPILSNYLKGDSYYGCLVYGSPHGDVKDGQYRYLGYTLDGEDYTNVAFPPDVAHSGYFEDQQWIYQPWWNGDVTKNYNIDFNNGIDGTDRYAQNIRHGILVYYTDTNNANNYQVHGIDSSTQEFWDNIHNYVHVLAPPTKWAWGIGRMWRYNSGGQINYMTVPLLPDALLPEPGNLKAVSIDLGVPQGQKAEAGAEYTATVVFENESDQAYPGTPVAVLHGEYQATLYDENGQPLPKKTVGGKEVQVADFGKKGEPNARRTFTCKWHPFAQAKDGLIGIVNRDEIGKAYLEVTYEDNIVRAEIPVELVNLKVTDITLAPDPGEPGQLTSGTIAVKNESGQEYKGVKVAWKVRHQDGSDLDGNTIVTDLAAGESKALPFTFTPDVAGTCSVAAMVNPFHDNPPNEVNWLSGDWPGDNRKEVPYTVKGKDYDIKVEIIRGNPYDSDTLSSSNNPARMFVNVKVTRKDNLPDSLPVRLTINGGDQAVEQDITLDAGGSYIFKMYNITVYQSGYYSVEAQAWPADGSWTDVYPDDNVDNMTLRYIYISPPDPRDSGIGVDIIGGY